MREVLRSARAVARHHRTGGQGEAQGVGLIVKIENHLSGHTLLPRSELRGTWHTSSGSKINGRRWRRDEGARAVLFLDCHGTAGLLKVPFLVLGFRSEAMRTSFSDHWTIVEP